MAFQLLKENQLDGDIQITSQIDVIKSLTNDLYENHLKAHEECGDVMMFSLKFMFIVFQKTSYSYDETPQ